MKVVYEHSHLTPQQKKFILPHIQRGPVRGGSLSLSPSEFPTFPGHNFGRFTCHCRNFVQRLVVSRHFSSFMLPFHSCVACRNLPYQGLFRCISYKKASNPEKEVPKIWSYSLPCCGGTGPPHLSPRYLCYMYCTKHMYEIYHKSRISMVDSIGW